jgi:hypothetical protein
MCNPAIFALALTAAGSAAQAAGARKAAKAMEGARIAESIRQKGFQSQADSINSESLSKSGRDMTDKGMAESAAARSAASDAAVADVRRPVEATGSNLAGDQTANQVMATEGDLAAAKNLNYATQQGRAKANMLSFNDVTFQNAINNIRSGQQLNTVGNFMRGSSNVLPIELEAASRQGDSLKTLGTTLSTAGSVVGMGAGAGWWGSPAASAGGSVVSSTPTVTGANIIQPTSSAFFNPTTLTIPGGVDWSKVFKGFNPIPPGGIR